MRAALVSVEYADLLAITLPYNRHHFDEVLVVTTPRDTATQEVANEHDAKLFLTDCFYDDGAHFNKWKALERGLDEYGRHGWIVLMDADILWPKKLPEFERRPDTLYTPLCHIYRKPQLPLPTEDEWGKYPLRSNQAEWAGYSQIFHATDPHLPAPPWHQVDWKHAGGADSYFQANWLRNKKVRPPFNVFHIGKDGTNWHGRVTPFLTGGMPERVDEKRMNSRRMYDNRAGKPREQWYDEERIL